MEHAVLAYRWPDRATMSLQSRCGGPTADAATMARHLRIGLQPYTLRQAGPTQVASRDAWSQVFDAQQDGRAVRVKTVTLVERGCILDWVLAAKAGFEEVEPGFDAWVDSVRWVDDAPAAGGAP